MLQGRAAKGAPKGTPGRRWSNAMMLLVVAVCLVCGLLVYGWYAAVSTFDAGAGASSENAHVLSGVVRGGGGGASAASSGEQLGHQQRLRPGRISLDLDHPTPGRVVPKPALPDHLLAELEKESGAGGGGHEVEPPTTPTKGRVKVEKEKDQRPQQPPAQQQPGAGAQPAAPPAAKPAEPPAAKPAAAISGPTTEASIAAFAATGSSSSSWVMPLETPSKPHPQLYPALFGSGDPVPEPGCDEKWGHAWMRKYYASRQDMCVPSAADVRSAAASGLDSAYAPQAGSLAWEDRAGWKGAVDEQYGVRLGPDKGSKGGPKMAPSRVTRWKATTGSHFEWMRNVAVDFSRKRTAGNDHTFDPGFIQVACDQKASFTDMDQGAQPAFRSVEVKGGNIECDSWIHTPTMVLQHEDIGNTYHNLGDFLRAWIGLALLSSPMCVPEAEAKDPTRAHGPAGTLRQGKGGDGYIPPSFSCPAGTVAMPGLDPDHMLFLNMDARLMCGTIDIAGNPITAENREDCFGPYFPQYNTWYGQGVTRARELGGQRICFSALGFAAVTPESHVWDHFGETNDCATSPLLRSYSTYVAARWGLAGAGPRAYRSDACRHVVGEKVASSGRAVSAPSTPVELAPFKLSLPTWVFPEPGKEAGKGIPGYKVVTSAGAGGSTCSTPQPYIRVVYVARKVKPFNSEPVRNRVIANEEDFFTALKGAAEDKGVDLDLVEADFALMPYVHQVRLTCTASILIGMHGAGLVHGLDLADADECGGSTGVIELFPLPNEEKGIRNMVVQNGKNYWTWHNTNPTLEGPAGTSVDKTALRAVVGQAFAKVLEQRAACR